MVWVPEKKQLLDLLVNYGTTSEASADEVQRRWGSWPESWRLQHWAPGILMGPPWDHRDPPIHRKSPGFFRDQTSNGSSHGSKVFKGIKVRFREIIRKGLRYPVWTLDHYMSNIHPWNLLVKPHTWSSCCDWIHWNRDSGGQSQMYYDLSQVWWSIIMLTYIRIY